jgi:hypothetical protein
MTLRFVVNRALILASALVLASACVGGGAGLGPGQTDLPSSAPAQSISGSPMPTLQPYPTLPPGVALIPGQGTPLEPGTYWWLDRRPFLELRIPEGWTVGHHKGDFFDLFRTGGSLPAVSLGRFPQVFRTTGEAVGTFDAASVVEALSSHPGVVVDDVGPVTLAGLSGRTIDVRVAEGQTPLFRTQEGSYNADPGHVSRYHVLDVPGGAIEVWIVARDGELDAALEIARPLLDGLSLVD